METNKNFTSVAASCIEVRIPGLHFESLKCAILATNREVVCLASGSEVSSVERNSHLAGYEVELRFEPRFAELDVHAPPKSLLDQPD